MRMAIVAALTLLPAGAPGASRPPATRNESAVAAGPPRLVVVVVVDQLRADYIDRFRPFFGEGGFERFIKDGARMTRARYRHGITVTCAGHATILTGSSPAVSGIIANEWWNAGQGRVEYCARDDDSPLVGVHGQGRSPKNLVGSTVGDVLRLSNGGRSHVIAVSGKDRSAIMLGGRVADAAYWMEDTLFVTSKYYRDTLPEWVRNFNASGQATSFFGRTWDRVLPPAQYAGQGPDDAPWERDKGGMGRAFPHVLGSAESTPGKRYVEALEYSPFQNELVVDFAIEAVRNEGLGGDNAPDILAVGLSANDRIGHAFGPDSHEVLDMMVRTDRLLARFLDFLDQQVGLDSTVVVLTADHGVAPVPEYAQSRLPGLGARRVRSRTLTAVAESTLVHRFGPSPDRRWVAFHDAPSIYLNETALEHSDIPVDSAAVLVANAIARVPGINSVRTRAELLRLRLDGDTSPVSLSFFPGRSGHVVYVPDPYVVVEPEPDGTTHGTPWSYDQSVPVLFLGNRIRVGSHDDEVHVVDIAPTLSVILGIDRPAAATGKVLTGILR